MRKEKSNTGISTNCHPEATRPATRHRPDPRDPPGSAPMDKQAPLLGRGIEADKFTGIRQLEARMPIAIQAIAIEDLVAAGLDNDIVPDKPLCLPSPLIGEIESFEREVAARFVKYFYELARTIRRASRPWTNLIYKQLRKDRQRQLQVRCSKRVGPLQGILRACPKIILGPRTILLILQGQQITMHRSEEHTSELQSQ